MLDILPFCDCIRLKAPLRIDGDVHKQTWNWIRPIVLTNNLLHVPRYETWVKAAWHDTHLYLAFWGADEDAWSTFYQHDDPLFRQEVFEFFFSPDGDLDRYFELEWNPNDAVFDGKISFEQGKRKLDAGWTAEKMVSVSRIEKNADGSCKAWSCEVALPFACIDTLEHPPYPKDRWRVNFFRIDMPERKQPQELYAWSPTQVANFHMPNFFGQMVFKG